MYINKPQFVRERGVSLIELIMYIVIVSIALAGITTVMNQTTGRSADTIIRKQAHAAAESLLEEIEAHAVSGVYAGASNQTNRPNFDNVFNYNGFATSGVFPASGATAVSGLGSYTVAVTVVNPTFDNIPSASAAQITVTVTPPAGPDATSGVSVTGYRTAY